MYLKKLISISLTLLMIMGLYTNTYNHQIDFLLEQPNCQTNIDNPIENYNFGFIW